MVIGKINKIQQTYYCSKLYG